MMTDTVRLFVLTAKYLSLTRAARECCITLSAASRQLKQLEHDLRIKPFKKAGRGIELTSSGRKFLSEVSPIWSQFDELWKKYAPKKDSITVAASYRPSKYLLPELMTEFVKKHPTADLVLHTHSSVEIEKLLLDDRADIAITTNPSVPVSAFVKEPYFSEPLVPFVAAFHPLAKMKSLRPEETGTIPVILKPRREGESRTETLLGKLEKDGFKFKAVVRCDSPEVVKEFVRQGAGVGLLYYSSIKRGIGTGYFKTIHFPGLDLVGENFIVYPKEKALSALAKEFLSFLRASVTKNLPIKATISQVSYGRSNGNAANHILRSKLPY